MTVSTSSGPLFLRVKAADCNNSGFSVGTYRGRARDHNVIIIDLTI